MTLIRQKFPRVQEVLLPILREALPEAQIGSWHADIDYREYPVINLRRLGGFRSRTNREKLDHPVLELTVYHNVGLPEAEVLYIRALEALYEAHASQRVVDAGHISYVQEVMGHTQFPSPYEDSYRVQGLIEIGVRAPRKKD